MGRLYWSKAPFLNFGDDLNLWLWPRMFPEFFTGDSDDILVGIGTILGPNLPKKGRAFIMGSGAGYAAIPKPEDRSNWTPIFVRGPLTARVLGLPPKAAITDGAFLASRYVMRTSKHRQRKIFIPHWKSELSGDWAQVCGYAGFHHVSPMQPVDTVIDEIASAELVVTESMHGAILADALRVPWVAARTSPELNDFKWIDWCMTIGVRHRPFSIPPTGNYDFYRQNKARAVNGQEAFAAGRDDGETQLVEAFMRRFPSPKIAPASAPSGRAAQLSRYISEAREAISHWIFQRAKFKPSVLVRDLELKEKAAIALSIASTQTPILSEDVVHSRLMEQLSEAADRFRVVCAK